MKSNLSSARKIFFSSLFLFLFLVGLELALRIAGNSILVEQESHNTILPEDSEAIRILTIGESTTADWFSDKANMAWPRQLESLLKANGLKVRVYNLGRSATTTGSILQRLPEQLSYYRPHIVISMMGINDPEAIRISPVKHHWIEESRVWKLLKWCYQVSIHLRSARRLEPRDFSNWKNSARTIDLFKAKKYSAAWLQVETDLANKDASVRAQYLDFLARKLLPPLGPPSEEFRLSFELYRKSLKEYFEVRGAAAEYVFLMSKLSEFEDCEWVARSYQDKFGEFSELMMMSLSACVKNAKNQPSQGNNLIQLIRHNNKNLEVDSSSSKELNTKKNYLLLQQILKESGIRHLAMQYPTRAVSPLINMLSDTKPGTVFVSNENNFKEAISKYGYDKIFTDHFAGEFGHTTFLGHSLLAESACIGLEPILKQISNTPLPNLHCQVNLEKQK